MPITRILQQQGVWTKEHCSSCKGWLATLYHIWRARISLRDKLINQRVQWGDYDNTPSHLRVLGRSVKSSQRFPGWEGGCQNSSTYCRTALQWAITNKLQPSVLRLLLEAGTDIITPSSLDSARSGMGPEAVVRQAARNQHSRLEFVGASTPSERAGWESEQGWQGRDR